MTASIKASADGLSAIIQVGGADKLTINSNGSLVTTADPATGVRSKALATMQKFADEFGSSLAANGYQKLPSGLIIQWGNCSPGASAVFPITFPNACWALSFSNNGGGYISYSSSSPSGFACIGATSGGGNYIAIGY